jgi:hypothetical protein
VERQGRGAANVRIARFLGSPQNLLNDTAAPGASWGANWNIRMTDLHGKQ